LTRHRAQAPAVLDRSRTVLRGDRRAGPALTRRAAGDERNLIVLDASNVLHDALAHQASTMSMRKAKCVRVTAIAPVVAAQEVVALAVGGRGFGFGFCVIATLRESEVSGCIGHEHPYGIRSKCWVTAASAAAI